MITSANTGSLSAFWMNTIVLVSQSATKAASGSSAGIALLDLTAKPERLSSHGKKRALGNIMREREQNDPAYKARMIDARKLLAEEIHEISPEDSFVKRRLAKGLSQQRLASLMTTSQSHIAKIEAGSIHINFETAIKLADALNISLDDIRKLVEISHQPKPSAVGS